MCFNAIHENKILTKFFEFTVVSSSMMPPALKCGFRAYGIRAILEKKTGGGGGGGGEGAGGGALFLPNHPRPR